ncbi:MAG: ABC transporter permease [Gemmatimonadales bacterium]|nr:ABC transporter permease [Gemmatimonadales bacterium]
MIRPGIERLFRLALRRLHPARAEVDDEVALHLELRAEQFVRQGWDPGAARAEARRRFGGRSSEQFLHRVAQERERRMRVAELAEGIGQDIRIALRGLRREPRLTGFIVGTMALGIGANAAMFGVADRLLLRGPEHVRDSKQVVHFYYSAVRKQAGEQVWGIVPYAAYDNLRTAAQRFEGVAVYSMSSALVGVGATTVPAPTAFVSGEFFPLLGVQPALGRFFTAAESEINTPQHVAILGHGYWRRAYGGDRGVLGNTLVIGQEQYVIIGVAPRGFSGPRLESVDLWLPLNIRGAQMYSTKTVHWTRRWNTSWLGVVGRLKPGVSLAEAGADATRVHSQLYDGTDDYMRTARMLVRPFPYESSGKETPEVSILRWLVGVSLAVLLIACSNVGNLLLARTVRRRGEIAVRLALGAGRARLTRLLMTEGVVLALAGGIAGLVVAYAAGTLVRGLVAPNVEWTESPLGATVLIASLAIALITGVLVGLIPAARAGRSDLTEALKSSAREGMGHRSRARGLLTVAQAALSVVLLVGAGLFVRSLLRVEALDLGFEADRVLSISVRWSRYPGNATAADSAERRRRLEYYRQALDAIKALPGVAHASRMEGPPPLEGAVSVNLKVPGLDSMPSSGGGGPFVAAVSGDYFAAVGTRLLRGRLFSPEDGAGTAPVTIVSKSMAERLWPGKSPLGECLMIGDGDSRPCSTVVGVSADVRRFGVTDPPSMSYYVPVGQEVGFGGSGIVVRPSGETAPLIASIKTLLHRLDPTVVYVDAGLLQDQLDPQIRPWKLGATMFVLCGVLALLVAAIGLYSVISYLVAQRTHELGVRIALGARSGDIVGLVVRDGMTMAAAGAALGIGLALLGGKWLQPLLFETSAKDPLVLGGVGAGLLAVAFVASVLPALRAKRVSPMAALRSE